jgi:hypothetical protein
MLDMLDLLAKNFVRSKRARSFSCELNYVYDHDDHCQHLFVIKEVLRLLPCYFPFDLSVKIDPKLSPRSIDEQGVYTVSI